MLLRACGLDGNACSSSKLKTILNPRPPGVGHRDYLRPQKISGYAFSRCPFEFDVDLDAKVVTIGMPSYLLASHGFLEGCHSPSFWTSFASSGCSTKAGKWVYNIAANSYRHGPLKGEMVGNRKTVAAYGLQNAEYKGEIISRIWARY